MASGNFKRKRSRRSSLFTIEEDISDYNSLPEEYMKKVELEKRKWNETIEKLVEEKAHIESELLNNTEIVIDSNKYYEEQQEFIKGAPDFNAYLRQVDSFMKYLTVRLEYDASYDEIEEKKKECIIKFTSNTIKNIVNKLYD